MERATLDLMKVLLIDCDSVGSLEGRLIPRDVFMNQDDFKRMEPIVAVLKKYLSSSTLTALQSDAGKVQRWPVLNLIRQVLRTFRLNMEPVRKSDGRTPEGKKKFKRFFLITSQKLKDGDHTSQVQ